MVIREFNFLHAEVYNRLQNKIKIKGAYFGAFKCGQGVTDTKTANLLAGDEVIILTSETIFAVDKDFKIVWHCEIKNILLKESIEKQNSQAKVKFTYTPSTQNRTLTKEVSFQS